MLTGPSASGKTTTAHKLAEELVRQGMPARVVSLDNFFRGAEYYPRMPDGTTDYENLETLDLPFGKPVHQGTVRDWQDGSFRSMILCRRPALPRPSRWT